MIFRNKFYFLLFMTCGWGWTDGITPSQCDNSTFGRLLFTLYNDVEFMNTRKNQLNIDAAFGLALAEANIAAILRSDDRKYLNDKHLNSIIEIRELARESRKFVRENLKTDTDRRFSEVLTRVDLWIRPISWKNHSSLVKSAPDRRSVGDLTHAGTPDEQQSDHCLLIIINQFLTGKSCRLSEECLEIITRNDRSRGYAMTHRLLISQVANALRCEKNPSMDSRQLIEDLCGIIHQDLQELMASGFPGVGVDLAIEQIFLCGMEGYSEFVTSRYKNFLLNQPNSLGCFSASGFRRNHRMSNISKRSSNPMDFGCDNHTCGVAAAALSLLLRECIENSQFYINK
ncbi:uncharacterized protein [Fopius arisanus]|uniref:Uncharacterized protein n=1 Tax=Fopius arisanus TaxID=64838 RepID=A0A9R1TNH8_9HYME|nr:PREDICTED: uncharacterized protein LOC105272183 [Fopius arisanus]